MSKFSDYLEGKIIETTLRGAAMPAPSSIYIALYTADPSDAGTSANEVAVANWPGYVRQDAAQGAAISTGWTAASNGVSSNAKVVTFPANNGASPVVVGWLALHDAQSGGNMLYHAPLVASKTLQVGDVLSFGIGALTVTVQ